MIQRGPSLFQVFGMRYRNISFLDILVIINTGKNSIFKLENLMHCSFDRAENTADNDANKEQDLDDRPDIQESKSIPLSIGTVKKHMGADGTLSRNDNQISSSSPGFANTVTKLNSSPIRKAFSVQDKVYALWLATIFIMRKQAYVQTCCMPFPLRLMSNFQCLFDFRSVAMVNLCCRQHCAYSIS
jgi:hypothetical protein